MTHQAKIIAILFLFYIYMYDMRWRLESPPPCTVNDGIHCKYLEAPSTGGYQCTMDTLSQSIKLQQLPEADADALLRLPADSES